MDRTTYLETLVPLAVRLIGVVHDEGPDATAEVLNAITALPHPDDLNPHTALAITLAAMADPGRSIETTLGWVRQLDPGADTLPPPQADTTARLAVELALAGHIPAGGLTDDEGAEVTRILMDRGWGEAAVREHLDGDHDTVHRWANRVYGARQRAAKSGTAA